MDFGIREGSWWVTSKLDPRWNGEGRAVGIAGGAMACETHIAAMKKKYGEPPSDLEYNFMKD